MNLNGRATAGFAVLIFAMAARTQSVNRGVARGAMRVAAVAPAPGGEVFREIDDAANRQVWLLLRDPERPAGPGRMVLALRRTGKDRNRREPLAEPALPVIHIGDTLTVEEHTPVLDMRLQAVALEPGVKGRYFTARLKIGGKLARVIAMAPGHAEFGPESETKP